MCNFPRKSEVTVDIRPMTAGDWPRVGSIYREGIATRQATFEQSEPSWETWDAGHLPMARLVATNADNNTVIGWAALSRVSARAAYSGVAEVSVYVGGDFRGKGVGSNLLKALILESEKNGIWTLQASMFPENDASLALHKSCGFRVVGTREKIARLDGVWRDTLLLERRSKNVN
jgi:L-amino acid N-acyltransferase YncA